MQIETPRLILRSLCEEDSIALAQATDETWEDLSKWMRWATDYHERTDVANCSDYIRNCQQLFTQGQDLTFGGFSKDNNELVLVSRIAPHATNPEIYEFCGYWCRKSYQGRGYMTEAVQAISQFAFDTLNAQALQIKHATGNSATRAVMDKVGFIETEILKNAHPLPDGSIVDEHILQKLSS